MPNSSRYTLPHKNPRLESYPVTSCSCGNSVTLKVTSQGIVGVYAPCDETSVTLAKLANEKPPCSKLRYAILTELRDHAVPRLQGIRMEKIRRIAEDIFLTAPGCGSEWGLGERNESIRNAQYHLASILWAHSKRRQKMQKERQAARLTDPYDENERMRSRRKLFDHGLMGIENLRVRDATFTCSFGSRRLDWQNAIAQRIATARKKLGNRELRKRAGNAA